MAAKPSSSAFAAMGVAAVALVFAVYFYFARTESVEGGPSLAQQGAEDISLSSPQEVADPISPRSERFQSTPASLKIFSEYRCQKAQCDLSPFLAETEQEALWLKARGYPSQAQFEEAKRLPTSELKLRAQKGDLVYGSLYGERLMEEGNWNDSKITLAGTAMKGSIYALYGLSRHASNNPEFKDAVDAKAWIRAAYLAGDYKSTLQLVTMYPERSDRYEQVDVDRIAAHRFKMIMKYRYSPRPMGN